MSYDRDYKGYACEYCKARFVYNDSLDRHRSRCPQTEKYRAAVVTLKKRLALARTAILRGDALSREHALRLLDLRKPVSQQVRRRSVFTRAQEKIIQACEAGDEFP